MCQILQNTLPSCMNRTLVSEGSYFPHLELNGFSPEWTFTTYPLINVWWLGTLSLDPRWPLGCSYQPHRHWTWYSRTHARWPLDWNSSSFCTPVLVIVGAPVFRHLSAILWIQTQWNKWSSTDIKSTWKSGCNKKGGWSVRDCGFLAIPL